MTNKTIIKFRILDKNLIDILGLLEVCKKKRDYWVRLYMEENK